MFTITNGMAIAPTCSIKSGHPRPVYVPYEGVFQHGLFASANTDRPIPGLLLARLVKVWCCWDNAAGVEERIFIPFRPGGCWTSLRQQPPGGFQRDLFLTGWCTGTSAS